MKFFFVGGGGRRRGGGGEEGRGGGWFSKHPCFILYRYLHKILSNLVHLNNEADISNELSVQGCTRLFLF